MITPRASRRHTGLGLPATYRLIKEGVIPAIQVGNRWLIPQAALEQALAENALALSAQRRDQKLA
jgi:excisionase family DNA binding protein